MKIRYPLIFLALLHIVSVSALPPRGILPGLVVRSKLEVFGAHLRYNFPPLARTQKHPMHFPDTNTQASACRAAAQAHPRKDTQHGKKTCSEQWEMRTYRLCPPTTRDHPHVPKNFDIFKSSHGFFAYFIAEIKVTEIVNAVISTHTKRVAFYRNQDVPILLETARQFASEFEFFEAVSITWLMVEYVPCKESSLDDLD